MSMSKRGVLCVYILHRKLEGRISLSRRQSVTVAQSIMGSTMGFGISGCGGKWSWSCCCSCCRDGRFWVVLAFLRRFGAGRGFSGSGSDIPDWGAFALWPVWARMGSLHWSTIIAASL